MGEKTTRLHRKENQPGQGTSEEMPAMTREMGAAQGRACEPPLGDPTAARTAVLPQTFPSCWETWASHAGSLVLGWVSPGRAGEGSRACTPRRWKQCWSHAALTRPGIPVGMRPCSRHPAAAREWPDAAGTTRCLQTQEGTGGAPRPSGGPRGWCLHLPHLCFFPFLMLSVKSTQFSQFIQVTCEGFVFKS